MSYEKYLNSPQWAARRDEVLDRAGNRCEYVAPRGWRCPRVGNLQVHHLHYDTVYRERPEDLQALCDYHHRLVTVTGWRCAACGRPVYPDTGWGDGALGYAAYVVHTIERQYPGRRVIDVLKSHGSKLCACCESPCR
jgi:hypothetical protein